MRIAPTTQEMVLNYPADHLLGLRRSISSVAGGMPTLIVRRAPSPRDFATLSLVVAANYTPQPGVQA
jgi:hypothetical protein